MICNRRKKSKRRQTKVNKLICWVKQERKRKTDRHILHSTWIIEIRSFYGTVQTEPQNIQRGQGEGRFDKSLAKYTMAFILFKDIFSTISIKHVAGIVTVGCRKYWEW